MNEVAENTEAKDIVEEQEGVETEETESTEDNSVSDSLSEHLDAKADEALESEQPEDKLEDKPEDKPEDKQEGKPEEKSEGESEANPDEELDDYSIPDDITSEESKNRFQDLANRANKAEENFTQLQQTHDNLVGTITQAFPGEGELQQVVQLGSLLNSQDINQQKQGLQFLEEVYQTTATRLGIDTASNDQLSAYPDLIKQVDDMELGKEQAIEIASARQYKSQMQENNAQQQAMVQDEQAFEAAKTETINQVSTMLQSYKEKDPDYAVIEEQLKPMVKQIAQTMPLEHWAGQVEQAYNLVKSGISLVPKPEQEQAPLEETGMTAANKIDDDLGSYLKNKAKGNI